MKLLIDMNLSPDWVKFLEDQGWDALHWSRIGDPGASDATIMAWARENGRVVFTHDLDFSALVAHSGQRGPSVLQMRTHAVLPGDIGLIVALVLRRHHEAIASGAIVTIDEAGSRVRILPIGRD